MLKCVAFNISQKPLHIFCLWPKVQINEAMKSLFVFLCSVFAPLDDNSLFICIMFNFITNTRLLQIAFLHVCMWQIANIWSYSKLVFNREKLDWVILCGCVTFPYTVIITLLSKLVKVPFASSVILQEGKKLFWKITTLFFIHGNCTVL